MPGPSTGIIAIPRLRPCGPPLGMTTGRRFTSSVPRLMKIFALGLVPSLLVAQAQPVPQTTAKPGWQWTMDSVLKVVNTVRAGRSLQPAAWPNGARVAVLLSFDVDNETIALRFGEPNASTLSQGQYGARRGLQRVVRLLDRH